jgi:hypothetical protein
MRYWFDMEFIEKGAAQPIRPLSIGIVAEDGRTLYRQYHDTHLRHLTPWLLEHVHPKLEHIGCWAGLYPWEKNADCPWRPAAAIAAEIRVFCDPVWYGKPEFWAYYADYDWVALCQTFGSMNDLPDGWPMYCRDLKQWCDSLGNPKLPSQNPAEEHHALNDARWTKAAWDFLLRKQVSYLGGVVGEVLGRAADMAGVGSFDSAALWASRTLNEIAQNRYPAAPIELHNFPPALVPE